MNLNPPPCTYCHRPTRFVGSTRTYRRENRVITVPTGDWECRRCPDPFTGEYPFRFADMPLLAWTDEQAHAIWLEKYGEPMPPSDRGRHPGAHRVVRVPVLLTPAEAMRLDEARGSASRGEYLRRNLPAAK